MITKTTIYQNQKHVLIIWNKQILEKFCMYIYIKKRIYCKEKSSKSYFENISWVDDSMKSKVSLELIWNTARDLQKRFIQNYSEIKSTNQQSGIAIDKKNTCMYVFIQLKENITSDL